MTPLFLESLFQKHLGHVLAEAPVPDIEEELNWRLFLAHSQDMQGFAADIVIGGPNERDHPTDPAYQGVRDLWTGTSQQLLGDLAKVWGDRQLREQLLALTDGSPSGHGVQEGLQVLDQSGARGALLFADRLRHLTGDKVARKTNRMIRAYVQNAHFLGRFGYSFRQYLAACCPFGTFPSDITPAVEAQWRGSIERDFFNVGPAIANYLLCDWLLWLWKEGRIAWFESYKADSVHDNFVRSGLLPDQASLDFVAFCRTVMIPQGYGLVSGRPCPPRVLNACLWLEGNQSSAPQGTWRVRAKTRTRSRARAPRTIVRTPFVSVPDNGGSPTLFRDDDSGYEDWLDRNPDGYVLNVHRTPNASYLKLHRVGCSHLTGPRIRGQPLTKDYAKLCTGSQQVLVRWCREAFGVPPETTCYCVRRGL